MKRLFFLIVALIFIQLSGCATTTSTESTQGSDSAIPPDFFSSEMRTVRTLVGEKKFEEAKAYIANQQSFFNKRLADKTKPFPSELVELGNYIYRTDRRSDVDNALKKLAQIASIGPPENWPVLHRLLLDSAVIYRNLTTDLRLRDSPEPANAAQALRGQIERVNKLALSARNEIFVNTFDNIIHTGTHPAKILGTVGFTTQNYEQSVDFQNRALSKIVNPKTPESITNNAKFLSSYLSATTKSKVDEAYEQSVLEVLRAKPKSIDQLFSYSTYETPFTKRKIANRQSLSSVLKIGQSNTESGGFRVKLLQDTNASIKIIEKADDILSTLPQYDFVLNLNVTSAKSTRTVINETSETGRVKTGTRSIPNPEFTTAMIEYQTAQTEYRLAEQRAASLPATCPPLDNGCALAKLGATIGSIAASRKFNETSKKLTSTPQTIQEDVFQNYLYRKVTIESTKAAAIEAIIYDVEKKLRYVHRYPIQEKKRFNVLYNFRDQDVNSSYIRRQNDTESAVLQWEKSEQQVRFEDVFNGKNFSANGGSRIADLSAAVRGTVEAVNDSATLLHELKNGSSSASSSPEVIADNRFKSIVVVEGDEGFGTGFYVTSNLIISSNHVVGRRSLVPVMTFDGRKVNGTVIKSDRRLDLTLIQTDYPQTPLKIHSGPLRLGATVEG
jgi:serine protease Do